MTEPIAAVVIGAGPAGLAAGACLRRAGINFIMFEKAHAVGASWRRHYERLHLHTVKRYSALPFLPFPKDYPRYVPRALMVQYLERYAKHFDLAPRFGEAVHKLRRDAGSWSVEVAPGAVRARFVVIASGYNAEPVLPALPGLAQFKGTVIHSADYRSAAPFAGQAVLVVGMGNSGAEIALDLAEGGARPTLSLRDGVHIVPRELFGVPIQIVAMLATRLLPLRANDALFPPILDFALGDLGKFGIRRPPQGILRQIRTAAKIPVIDVGTASKIAGGAIKIAPAIAEIGADGARFSDGRTQQFTAIVMATGYRPNYPDLLGEGINPEDAETRAAGLYFVGFRNRVTGLLHEIGSEARTMAEDIARRGRC